MTMFHAAILFLLEPQKLFISSQQNNTILAILIEMDHASQADSLQTKETLEFRLFAFRSRQFFKKGV